MRICVVGPGRIGGNIARRLAEAGHDVTATFANDAAHAVAELAPARVHFEADALRAREGAEVLVISVPWPAIDAAWMALGATAGDAVVVDTTNPYGEDGLVPLEVTSAAFNARRFGMPPYAKAFNTLTSAFQHAAGEPLARGRNAMFYVASNDRAAQTVEPMIEAVGFVPVFLGGPAESELLEAPRRPGAVYGEGYSPQGAREVVEAFRRNAPIPAPA